MEWLIIGVLSIITIVIITLYFLLNSTIRNITVQLKEINIKGSNSKILLYSVNRSIGDLALEVNSIIKERQKIEAQYKRIDTELRQAIANISHDLRTPLTSIMGYIQLIEDNNLPDVDKKEYIEVVKKRAEMLEGLIVSFYDLSRLEAGEYQLELKPIYISSIICDIVASFYNDFKNKLIEPNINIDEKIRLVIADEKAVGRVVSNLIQNMLRYGKQDVIISIRQEERAVVTTFENDAPGLKDEDIHHIFDRFFTADRTRSGKSTGIGLTIAKQLVEQMGHSINARLIDGRLSIIITWKTK